MFVYQGFWLALFLKWVKTIILTSHVKYINEDIEISSALDESGKE